MWKTRMLRGSGWKGGICMLAGSPGPYPPPTHLASNDLRRLLRRGRPRTGILYQCSHHKEGGLMVIIRVVQRWSCLSPCLLRRLPQGLQVSREELLQLRVRVVARVVCKYLNLLSLTCLDLDIDVLRPSLRLPAGCRAYSKAKAVQAPCYSARPPLFGACCVSTWAVSHHGLAERAEGA